MPYITDDVEQYRRGVEETQQGGGSEKSYYLNLGPRADELSPEEIARIAQAQGWSLPKKYKIYGVPHSLKKDPINNIRAMAIGKWLASRKTKAKKKSSTKTAKKKSNVKPTHKKRARKKTARKNR